MTSNELLAMLKPSHPRVMIDEEVWERVRDLTRTARQPAEWYRTLRERAQQLLSKPASAYEIPDGRRLLSVSRQVKERVQLLALCFFVEHDDRYRDRLWEEVASAAGFPDWNPSHFLDTAEMTYALGIAYDWLFHEWSDTQRRTLREAIVTHGLKPGLECYEGRGTIQWPENSNNWNQVCNGGLTCGALAIADEEPEVAGEVVVRALASIPIAMGHYAPDGASLEGATYWDYGTRFNVKFLCAIQTAFGSDFGLLATEGFAESGSFQIYMSGQDRQAFDFADCQRRTLSSPMHFWMAAVFDRPEFSWFRLSQLARMPSDATVLDLLWYDARGKGFEPARLPLDRYFRKAECASLRSDWHDPDAVVLGVQAGSNNSLRMHRHLDLGSFIFESHGVRWVIDSGVDRETYMSHRHGNPKWHYYRIRAEGHNTMVINPEEGPDQEPSAEAQITTFESSPEQATVVVDLTQAYAPMVRQAERKFEFIDRRSLKVTDRVVADAPVDLWWFMHTEAQVELSGDGRHAIFTCDGKRLSAELAGAEYSRFEVMEAEPLPTSPKPQPQADNEGRRKLAIRFEQISDLHLSVTLSPAAQQ